MAIIGNLFSETTSKVCKTRDNSNTLSTQVDKNNCLKCRPLSLLEETMALASPSYEDKLV